MINWIRGIVIVSILAACAEALTRKAASGGAVRLAAGVCVALAVLWPLRLPETGDLLREFQDSAAKPSNTGEMEADCAHIMETYGAAQVERYLDEQLAGQGIEGTVTVTLNDTLIPVAAQIWVLHAANAEAARSYVAQTLALELNAITITTGKEGRP